MIRGYGPPGDSARARLLWRPYEDIAMAPKGPDLKSVAASAKKAGIALKEAQAALG